MHKGGPSGAITKPPDIADRDTLSPPTLMDEYELDYDVQEVRLSGHVFKVTTMANDALPLEMLMQLQTHRFGPWASPFTCIL